MMDTFERSFLKTEIQLSSGFAFDYSAPHEHEMSLNDVTNSLALICRYNGHCKKHYSVAQHSCMVGDMMELDGYDKESVLYGYMHDFGEAVFCDLPQPLKAYFKGSDLLQKYVEIEEDFIKRFYENLEIPYPSDTAKKNVKRYDILSLEFEMANILSNNKYSHSLVNIKGKKVEEISATTEYSRYYDIMKNTFACKEEDFSYSNTIDWGSTLSRKVIRQCLKY